MTWDKRLKRLMDKSSYKTVTDLAAAAGVSSASLGTALRGSHTPKVSTLEKLAEVLGTTVQYLMFGEGLTPGQTVPILNSEHIGLWLMDKLDMEDCEKITAPEFMDEKAFAWRCDVVDMSPCFPKGSLVFFDGKNDFDSQHLYALVSTVYRKGGNTPVESLRFNMRSTGDPDQLKAANDIVDYGEPVFREVIKTGGGFMLKPLNEQFDPISMGKMEVIASARFCLIMVDVI